MDYFVDYTQKDFINDKDPQLAKALVIIKKLVKNQHQIT